MWWPLTQSELCIATDFGDPSYLVIAHQRAEIKLRFPQTPQLPVSVIVKIAASENYFYICNDRKGEKVGSFIKEVNDK